MATSRLTHSQSCQTWAIIIIIIIFYYAAVNAP